MKEMLIKMLKGVLIIHKFGFQIFAKAWEYRDFPMFAIPICIIGAIVILFVALIDLGIIVSLRKISIVMRTMAIRTKTDFGIAIGKEGDNKHYTAQYMIAQIFPKYHPKEYTVYFKYRGKKFEVDDDWTHKNYEVGEKIPLRVTERINSKGKVLSRRIELAE
jgi:hypothetical protein